MTAVGHIAVGLIAARYVRSPAVACVVGIGSHAAMDMLLPEYRPWPPEANIPIIAWEAVASCVLVREAYKREERAGVLG